MGEYILAHDLGTSGNKATLFRTDGSILGACTVPYQVWQDGPYQAEQDAGDWWNAVCGSTKKLLADAGVTGGEVKAVSFSGQMMGCLPVDRQGQPLQRAIIWADTRAREQSARLAEKISDERFYRIVGHRNSPSYGIQKAMWLKDNRPEIYENTYKFLNAKDYIVYRLTGKFYTDPSDANSMTCFDLASRTWSEEIVEASGVDPDKLPKITESTTFVGFVTEEAAKETGLSVKTKVIMGAGDGVAANVGTGSVEPGRAYCCLGTSAWVASTSEKPVLDEQRRIVCWAHAVPGLYSPNGTMQYAGGSYAWMKKELCLAEELMAREKGTDAYSLINQEIASCGKGAGGVLFLPYLMGERAPRWDPDATGAFFGLRAVTTRAQMLRSVLEGIIMNMGIIFDILQRDQKIPELILIGGAARSDQWQTTIADIFGTRVKIPELLEESNSMGAAVIAGVGAGIFRDFSVTDRFIRIAQEREPDPAAEAVYGPARRKFDALYEALAPVWREENGK